jgi:hypothetical protein
VKLPPVATKRSKIWRALLGLVPLCRVARTECQLGAARRISGSIDFALDNLYRWVHAVPIGTKLPPFTRVTGSTRDVT